jgi:hypothetical protein
MIQKNKKTKRLIKFEPLAQHIFFSFSRQTKCDFPLSYKMGGREDNFLISFTSFVQLEANRFEYI